MSQSGCRSCCTRWEVRFSGFDGNNEGKQLSYARHFCKGKDRFTDLGERAWANSHMPTMDRNRVMLQVWKRRKNYYRDLTKDELVQILQAWRDERDRLNAEYEQFKKRQEAGQS